MPQNRPCNVAWCDHDCRLGIRDRRTAAGSQRRRPPGPGAVPDRVRSSTVPLAQPAVAERALPGTERIPARRRPAVRGRTWPADDQRGDPPGPAGPRGGRNPTRTTSPGRPRGGSARGRSRRGGSPDNGRPGSHRARATPRRTVGPPTVPGRPEARVGVPSRLLSAGGPTTARRRPAPARSPARRPHRPTLPEPQGGGVERSARPLRGPGAASDRIPASSSRPVGGHVTAGDVRGSPDRIVRGGPHPMLHQQPSWTPPIGGAAGCWPPWVHRNRFLRAERRDG